jgi:uroporphyrin-3 C-methyltransferase
VSDQEKKNIEQVVEEAETAAAASAESAATVEEPEPHVVASPTPAQPQEKPDSNSRKGSSFIAWLALLLVLVMAAGAAWSVLELQRREAGLVERVAELEGIARQKDSNLAQVADNWQAQLKAGLGKLQDELVGEAARQAQALQGVETLLAEQRAELARFSAADRESWLLAEAEYLLRLANQRLIMAGDTVAAQALLSSADDILRELDDVGLHVVRGAVAADLAAVRAVPRVDVEGIYLRLGALVEQADKLVIFQLPEREAQPRAAPAQNWQGRLQQGYEHALAKLSDYIVIRRRDVPMQALMDPQWEGLVRQNMRMLLEQAQVALLSGNQSLYKESLQRALHWVGEFFESDEAASRAMAREINQLIDLNVAATMPDIARSLRALDEAIEQRLQPGGSE